MTDIQQKLAARKFAKDWAKTGHTDLLENLPPRCIWSIEA